MAAQKQQHISVVFDIDSASIGVAVVAYVQGSSIPVREYFSERTHIDTHVPFEDFFARTLRVLEELSQKALRNSPASISDVYLNMGTPWVSSQKRVAHYKRKNKFIFTAQLAQAIIEKELKDPLSKNLDYHHFDDLEIFERRTVDIYVNGYPTLNAFDTHKKVSDVDIHSITSVISTTTKESFSHVIERTFSKEPQFISNTFVLYQALKTFVPHEDSAMILDVGGNNTQVYVVHNDHLSSIASFPVGREHIVEKLALRARVSKNKARSLLAMFTENILEDRYKEQLDAIMQEVYKVWMKPWFELCDELSAKKLLPSTICLVSPKDISSWLRYHILKTDELLTHVHANKKPQIIELAKLLQIQADEYHLAHLSDLEIVPSVDVVGGLISYHS